MKIEPGTFSDSAIEQIQEMEKIYKQRLEYGDVDGAIVIDSITCYASVPEFMLESQTIIRQIIRGWDRYGSGTATKLEIDYDWIRQRFTLRLELYIGSVSV